AVARQRPVSFRRLPPPAPLGWCGTREKPLLPPVPELAVLEVNAVAFRRARLEPGEEVLEQHGVALRLCLPLFWRESPTESRNRWGSSRRLPCVRETTRRSTDAASKEAKRKD